MMNYFKDVLKKNIPGMKLPTIEFEPFLSFGIAMNEKARIEMEQLIKKYDIDYVKTTKESKFLKDKLYICSRIELKYYYTKALACVILSKENEDLNSDLNRIFKRYWKTEYSYVTTRKDIDFLDYLNELSIKGQFSTKGFDCLVKMYMFLYFMIEYTDRYPFEEITFLNSVVGTTSENGDFDNTVRRMFDISKKEHKSLMMLLENITKKYFNSKDLGIACPVYLPYVKNTMAQFSELGIDVLVENNIENLSDAAKARLDRVKQLNSMINLILARENIDLKGLNVALNKKEQLDIMVLLYKHLKSNNIELIEFEKMKEEDKLFVYMDLMSFNLILTCIGLLAKVYKEGEVFFKEKFTEGLAEENSELKATNNALSDNIKVLEKDKEELASEIERLKLETKKLQLELDKHKDDTKELLALRNYMFANSLDLEEENLSDSDFNSILNDLKTVKVTIIGGSSSWTSKMKELLSEWNYIGLNQINFDKRLLNADWVIVNSVQNMHKLYYKAKENAPNNFAIISKTNVKLACEAIHKLIFNGKEL